MPWWNVLMSPVFVSLPSGKMHTSSPSFSAASHASYARASIAGSSWRGAIGIAFACRNTQLAKRVLKIRWSITKRIGRGLAAASTSAST